MREVEIESGFLGKTSSCGQTSIRLVHHVPLALLLDNLEAFKSSGNASALHNDRWDEGGAGSTSVPVGSYCGYIFCSQNNRR